MWRPHCSAPARRGGGAQLLRPHGADRPQGRGPAAPRVGRAGARRHRRGGFRPPGRGAPGALGRPGRGAAQRGVRARRRGERCLPGDPGGRRAAGLPGLGLLAAASGGRPRPAADRLAARGQRRGGDRGQFPGPARLRLDGRLQVDPGGGGPLSGRASGSARGAGQPRGRGAAGDALRAGHRLVRGARRALRALGATGLGPHRSGAGRGRGALPALRPRRTHHRPRSCTPTAGCTPSRAESANPLGDVPLNGH